MKKAKFSETCCYRLIPLHDVRLLVCATTDVNRSRAKRTAMFGSWDHDHNLCGLIAWDHGFRYGLFLCREDICYGLIAHEVFHLTHRILQYRNIEFSVVNHEPFAELCGWLTDYVLAELARMGVPVGKNFAPRRYVKGEPRIREYAQTPMGP